MPSLERWRHPVPFIFWAGAPLIVGAFLRLRGIGELEPFVDEGANILTALDPRVRQAFEPLEQGRPLLVWLFLPSGLLPNVALEIARSMTALAGLVTIGAIGWTLHRLAGRRAALWGMWIWAVMPIAVWHERLALQDPFVTALLAGAMACVTSGCRHESRRPGAWLVGAGHLLGIAFLLKISVVLAVPWLGVMYLGIQGHFGRHVFDRRLAWIAAGAVLPVVLLGSGLLRLGSSLQRYEALPDLDAGNVGAAAVSRLETWLGWYAGYGGWSLLLLGIVAIVSAGRFRLKLAWACAASWVLSILISSFFLNNVYGRYTLPDHLPLVLFLALAISGAGLVKWRAIAQVLGAVAVAGWTWIAAQIGTDSTRAAVPRAEIEQYVTGPWSGRGIHAVHRYLTDYAERHDTRCVVLVHRFLRPGCYGLLLAERGDPRVGVVPFTIYEPEDLSKALELIERSAGSERPVACFLLYEGTLYPVQAWVDRPGAPTRLVQTVERSEGESFRLYQILR